jgi:adenylate cyclase
VSEHSSDGHGSKEDRRSPVAPGLATHEEAFDEVHDFLVRNGAQEEEIQRAADDDVLDLLVADRLLLPSQTRYDEAEVSEITGMPVELSRMFWRALGFPDPRPDDKMFTELDIEAIRNLEAMVELGVGDLDTFLQLARVVGSSMARVADAEVSPMMLGMRAGLDATGDSAQSALRLARVADRMLPATARLLEFVWRRHVQAAIRRTMAARVRGGSATLPQLCVGFADMVGFTMLSQQLSEEELAALVTRFEDVAHDVVTARGGRVVKMIGDEVMFVSELCVTAAEIALALAETYADDELLSDVRVALAVGPVLAQDGDFYGPVVNLANRVVGVAVPGSVLVTSDFHDSLLDELSRAEQPRSLEESGFAFRALRPRTVKDIGRVQLWSLYRAGDEPHGLDRRMGRRWERLSEVLRDLDDLRERGEKLIAGGFRASSSPDGSRSNRAAEGGDLEGAQGE